jgi:hypothetical protein
MNNKSFEDAVQLIQNAETDNFYELAALLDRDPKKDLAGSDLRDCDLSHGDLKGANLRKTNLSNANLSETDLRDADLSYAVLKGANLSKTQLNGATVTSTIFSKENDLSPELMTYLEQKGAIFENQESSSDPVDVVSSSLPQYLSQYDSSLQGFINYFLFGKLIQIEIPTIKERYNNSQGYIPRLARARKVKKGVKKPPKPSNRVFILLTWLLAVVFLIAFGIIAYQSLILKSEEANSILYHAFSLILGCFIGALTTYLKMSSEQLR